MSGFDKIDAIGSEHVSGKSYLDKYKAYQRELVDRIANGFSSAAIGKGATGATGPSIFTTRTTASENL